MKQLIAVIKYLLSVHLLSLLVLSFFRVVLYLTNLDQVSDLDHKTELFLKAMLKGIQFDNNIACYGVLLPLLFLSIFVLFNKLPMLAIKVCNGYFILFYAIVFAISAADIAYFSYFFAHLNAGVFNWFAFGATTAGMLFQESSYYLYFGLYIILIVLFSFAVVRFGRKVRDTETNNLAKRQYGRLIPLTLILWGLCFIGVRGGFERYPLRVSMAYFSNNSFFNQLGVNPAFNLIKSSSRYFKKYNTLGQIMSVEDAISNVQQAFGVVPDANQKNPIARKIEPAEKPKGANVVVILMESLSVDDLAWTYNGKLLMPYMQELISKSYYFENFYSSGIHTNNGIASTLYGFPAQFNKTMMGVDVDHYTGLPYYLKNVGYQTLTFLTSNPQYDNMNSFLLENSFDRIYSQYDYPNEKVVNNFGVQDDFLFEYGIQTLNEVAKKDKPFFATLVTVSNHPPYIVPEKFKNAGTDDKEKIIAFMDNSLNQFMADAAKQEWYKNTIFVILGDHGRNIGKQIYDMPLSGNHIPLILHSPLFADAPKRFDQFGGQIDVFPTLMGLLGEAYTNNSLGVDLLKTKRRFMYFVSDTNLACVDADFLYIYNLETKSDGLYDYRNADPNNIKAQNEVVADSMKTYAVSMMIAADYVVKNKLVRDNTK